MGSATPAATDAPRPETNTLPHPLEPPSGAPLLLAGTVLLLLAAGTAAAHTGNGVDTVAGSSLELEGYDAPDPSCDPDFDGEHTEVKAFENSSGGEVAFAPHSGCGITFENVSVSQPGALDAVQVRRQNCGLVDAYDMTVRVQADGETVGTADFEFTRADCDTYDTAPFTNASTIPAGEVDLRIDYQVHDGSGWINAAFDRLDGTFSPVPSPPRNLTAEAGPALGTVHLDWDEPATDRGHEVERYEVYASERGTPFEHVASVPADATTYTDHGRPNGTFVEYKVTAVNAAGESLDSDPASATTLGPDVLRDRFPRALNDHRWDEATRGVAVGDACGASSGDRALQAAGGGTRAAVTRPIDLDRGGTVAFDLRIGSATDGEGSCDDAEDGEGVLLEYRPADGDWTPLRRFDAEAFATFQPVEVPLPDEAAADGTQLRWRQPSHGDGDNWALDDVTVGPVAGGPQDVTAAPGPDGVTVRWSAPGDTGPFDVDYYRILRASGTDAPQEVATVGPDQRSYTDGDPAAERTHTYRVQAHTRAELGLASAPASAPGTAAPAFAVDAGDGVAVYDDADGDGTRDDGEAVAAARDGAVAATAPDVALAPAAEQALPPRPDSRVAETCAPADLVCVGPTDVEEPVGRRSSRLAAGAAVTASGVSVQADSHAGETRDAGPFQETVDAPFTDGIPVTVCASGCPVPKTPTAEADGTADVAAASPAAQGGTGAVLGLP